MKLNYKRTVLVGFAFLLITAFWQAYDTIVPKILTDKFGLPQAWSGAIMALDNIFALFLLPFFGALSDRKNTRYGRRTPFIAVGTLLAAVLLIGLSFADRAQLQKLDAISGTKGVALEESLGVIWDENPAIRPDKTALEGTEYEVEDSLFAEKTPLQEIVPSREAFTAITPEDGEGNANPLYTALVVPARQAYAARVTERDPSALIVFVVILLFALVAMGTFRSPAVALMPDVTPKPLRSKANAIINLMGTAGGIVILLLGSVLGTGKAKNALMSYTLFFSIVAGLMLVALAVFLFFVREPKWAAEMQEESSPYENEVQESNKPAATRHLSRAERLSLLLILASVVFWFMGYNAVTSKYSVYAGSVLDMDYNATLLIANGAAIVSYIPVGIISSKFGRKKTILAGVLLLGTAFLAASFMRAGSPVLVMNLLFATAGIGWATINVNSYPMVVELAQGSDVGKYTGFYYMASMSAQVVTPVLSGVFLDISFTTLFPYATIFVAFAFVTMLFVRHGDVRPDAKQVMLDGVGGAD